MKKFITILGLCVGAAGFGGILPVTPCTTYGSSSGSGSGNSGSTQSSSGQDSGNNSSSNADNGQSGGCILS